MTALAEDGWVEEENGWAYYEGEGERAVSQLLEIDENYYYFGEDGLMVRNQWVAVENMETGLDEPEHYWYYFQDNGKAYKRSNSTPSGVTRMKEIDGKKYSFDSEGRMLFGWVLDGERLTDEDAWKEGEYYFGGENDGVMKDGWQKIHIVADPMMSRCRMTESGKRRIRNAGFISLKMERNSKAGKIRWQSWNAMEINMVLTSMAV